MEVEDIDDFLDAFVSTELNFLSRDPRISLGFQEINLTSESISINGTYRHVRSYQL